LALLHGRDAVRGAEGERDRGRQRERRLGGHHGRQSQCLSHPGKPETQRGRRGLTQLVMRRQIASSFGVGDALVAIRRRRERAHVILRTMVRNRWREAGSDGRNGASLEARELRGLEGSHENQSVADTGKRHLLGEDRWSKTPLSGGAARHKPSLSSKLRRLGKTPWQGRVAGAREEGAPVAWRLDFCLIKARQLPAIRSGSNQLKVFWVVRAIGL